MKSAFDTADSNQYTETHKLDVQIDALTVPIDAIMVIVCMHLKHTEM